MITNVNLISVIIIISGFLTSCNPKENKGTIREKFEKRRKEMKPQESNNYLKKDTLKPIPKVKNYNLMSFEGAWGEVGFPYAEFIINKDSLEYVENLGRVFTCKISKDTFYTFYKDTIVHTHIIRNFKNDTLVLLEDGKYEYQYYRLD